MDENPDFTHHPYYVCSLCECDKAVHVYFYDCPLLEGEKICIDCCTNDVGTDGIVEKFKELGLNYTKEQIDKICRECGKRDA